MIYFRRPMHVYVGHVYEFSRGTGANFFCLYILRGAWAPVNPHCRFPPMARLYVVPFGKSTWTSGEQNHSPSPAHRFDKKRSSSLISRPAQMTESGGISHGKNTVLPVLLSTRRKQHDFLPNPSGNGWKKSTSFLRYRVNTHHATFEMSPPVDDNGPR